jgi:hypothetical protein
MFKNVASQKVAVYAWDTVNRVAKTGDAANITGKISKDGGGQATTDDVNPTELDATNFPGVYLFDMATAETNADFIILQAKTTTTGIAILPVLIYTGISADMASISGSSTAADKLEASALTIEVAAAAAGTLSTTQMTTTLTEATSSHYIGRVIIWTSGVLLRQASPITAYDGGTKMLTFTAVTEAPTAGDTFIIV